MDGTQIQDARRARRPALTIVEAIRTVMRGRERPLSPPEAYAAVIEAGLYHFNTDNPVSIVRNQIRRRCEGVDFPSALPVKYFRATNDGRYALLEKEPSDPARPEVSSDQPTTLEQLLRLQKAHEGEVRARVLGALKSLTPSAFERFSERLLRAFGFEHLVVTRRSRDGGIDGHGSLRIGLSSVSVAFQCKRWRDKPVGRVEIDAFRGAVSGFHEQGYVFTTSRFTLEAVAVQRRPGAVPIILFDGERILDIMFDRAFGVGFREIRIPELDLDVVLQEG